MRFGAGLYALATAVVFSAPAWAQAWDVYTNRESFFTVNLPGNPTVTEAPYRTAKGTALTARVFTATASASSILAGTYTVTVVDYSNAQNEFSTAVAEAAKSVSAKGAVKYDGLNNLDLLFDPPNGEKLNLSAVGAPALGWPDVTLELCPGSRG